MGRWQNDRGRRTHCTKGRDAVCHEKIPGTLRTRAGGDETGGEGAGCSMPVVCGSDGIQETGSDDTITPVGGHPWR